MVATTGRWLLISYPEEARILIMPRHHLLILNLTGQISAMIKPHIMLEVIAFSQLSNPVSHLSDHLLSSFVLSHHISNTLFPNLIALPTIATVSNSARLHICHLYIVATPKNRPCHQNRLEVKNTGIQSNHVCCCMYRYICC
jgi:hypothetical protein